MHVSSIVILSNMLLKKSQDSIIYIYKKIVLGSAHIYYHIVTMPNVMHVLLNYSIYYDPNKFSKTHEWPLCRSED